MYLWQDVILCGRLLVWWVGCTFERFVPAVVCAEYERPLAGL